MADTEIESRIAEWRAIVRTRPAIAAADVDELEGHLRDQIDVLTHAGLTADEAFLIGVQRLGRIDDVSREFAREHSDRLWKQLALTGDADGRRSPAGLWLAIGLAVAAAIAVKLPALFGVATVDFYARNLAVLVLPFLAAYFVVRRRPPIAATAGCAASFVAAAVLLNVYPFHTDGATASLAGVHAIVALWLVVGILAAAGDWRSSRARMEWVRFTGEWFVYFVLLGLGGGVLAALTIGVFGAIGLDPEPFVQDWLIPCGAAGAALIAAWLVDAKQSVIENIAPVLTKVFTPLFTLLLLALIVAGLLQRSLVDPGDDSPVIFGDRDLLVIFDVVLIVVLGLLLYALSARRPELPPGWFERLQLVMLASALVVDLLVLVAMIGRIGAFGASPNKVASLGLNLILLVNLAGAAYLQVRFLRGSATFGRIERWQTGYLPVYLAWSAIVVAVFPPVFGYV